MNHFVFLFFLSRKLRPTARSTSSTLFRAMYSFSVIYK